MLDLRERKWSWLAPARVALTFALVTIGWVFFRAATLRESVYILSQMIAPPVARMLWPRWQLWAAVILVFLAILEERRSWFEKLPRAPVWIYAAALGTLLFGLETLGFSGKAVPFVYFQF